ncbi:MAG TPA: family 16 glycosylhydrolase [Bryobacteraceae bacterium]|nr:family 16 glycosylhydrolase [Bryobacteraceae bacterium]
MRPLLVMASAALLAAASAAAQPAPSQTSWQLVWSDEFNGPAGTPPDPAKWTYDLGTDCCGNHELETYTNAAENAHMDGLGHLDIHVENPSPGVYTSARIKTEGLYSVEYGRIEARLKIPFGQGMWPAFWMLGNNITKAGWPTCGEIDIMENIGSTPSTAYGGLHGPDGYDRTVEYELPNGQKLADDFHTYAVEWSPPQITFYVDGNLYETQTNNASGWVFNVPNNPFFIILNAAVGGDWPGAPDSTTQFPQDMLVDYVRVYQAVSTPGPVLNSGGIVDAASGSAALAPGSLASIYGTGLAEAVNAATFDTSAGAFSENASGVQVFVNGAASPLIYLAPQQINFAIPWDSLLGAPLQVEVMLNTVLSNPVPITLASTAPSVFNANGAAIVTCPDGLLTAGAYCTLWGNGFGATTTPLSDGVPALAMPLPWTTNPCTLTIAGIAAKVTYCGAAPGEVIYQLNFVYPEGVSTGTQQSATIAITGNSGNFVWP